MPLSSGWNVFASTLIVRRAACGLIQELSTSSPPSGRPHQPITHQAATEERQSERVSEWVRSETLLSSPQIFPPLDLPSVKVLFSPSVSLVTLKREALPLSYIKRPQPLHLFDSLLKNRKRRKTRGEAGTSEREREGGVGGGASERERRGFTHTHTHPRHFLPLLQCRRKQREEEEEEC